MKKLLFTITLLNVLSFKAQVWTWMHGTDTLDTYGISGGNPLSNRPPSLRDAQAWTDNNGNFWLYGGEQILNSVVHNSAEMWMFNVSSNQWTKVSGTNTLTIGVYGTLNVPSINNTPGSRISAATWTDSNNNLWMFGGYGVGTSTVLNSINDLWKYTPSTNQWTWMGGPNQVYQPALYGTLGVPANSNLPGARTNSQAWSVNDTLYLYGGVGRAVTTWGSLSDLWRYVISTGQWTWIKGPNSVYQQANFGTLGFQSSTNSPGGRSRASTWVDNNRTLWMYGGNAIVPGFGTCNSGDLWRYNINSNMWTWMKGSNQPYPFVQYGPLNVSTSTATPGMRMGAAAWTDNNGDLWLFGGNCLYQSPNIVLGNDLWKYTITSNQWTWIHGPNTSNNPGNYGTRFLPHLLNVPPPRHSPSTFKDALGNFWLNAGAGNLNQRYTDLWRLSTCTISPTPPSGLVASSSSVCAGGTLQFSVNPTSTFVFWQTIPPSTGLPSGATISLLKQPGIYTVFAQSVNMCTVSSNNSMISFTVHAQPIITSTGGTVCAGEIYTLNALGANSYSWSTGSATIQPTSNTSYTVTGYGTTGCASQNSVVGTVTVYAKPLLAVNAGSICAGQTFTLNPSGASNYSYTSGTQTVSQVVSPPVPGAEYTITGSSLEGCVSNVSTTVQTYSVPVISISGGAICNGNTFTITPQGAQDYTFSSGSAVVSPTQTQSYSVWGKNTAGCVNDTAAVVTVTVNPNPTVTFNQKDSVACFGELRAFTATGAPNIIWQDFSSSLTHTVLYNFSYSTITATGTDANNCKGSISMILKSELCTGLSEATTSMKVFPNPFDRFLHVDTDEESEVQVIGLTGVILYTNKIWSGENVLDLSSLASGIYVLTVRGLSVVRMWKVVKT